MVNANVELYTDGSAAPRNPGPAGLGYIIRYWEQEDKPDTMPVEKTIEGSFGFRLSTNNRMELTACIYGIEKIIENVDRNVLQGIQQITLFSDSEYLVRAINEKWIVKWQSNGWQTSAYGQKKSKPVRNRDLWEKILELQFKLRSMGINLTMNHVEGHAGNPFNEKADQLATAASANPEGQLVDKNYESGEC